MGEEMKAPGRLPLGPLSYLLSSRPQIRRDRTVVRATTLYLAGGTATLPPIDPEAADANAKRTSGKGLTSREVVCLPHGPCEHFVNPAMRPLAVIDAVG